MKTVKCKVAVVGGGVIGLTTAIRLVDAGFDVSVLAAELGINTSSVKASAIWHVYLVPETSEVLRWAGQTLNELYSIADNFPESGVEIVRGIELFRKSDAAVPSWAGIPKGFRMLLPHELKHFNDKQDIFAQRLPVKWGYRIEAPAAKMDCYLPWLESRLRRQVEVRMQRVDSMDRLLDDFDLVVNCTGLGSSDLLGDKAFSPCKGQYFIVDDPNGTLVDYIGDDDHPRGMSYVMRRSGELLIGGTVELGRSDLGETLDYAEVVSRAGLYVPRLLEPETWGSRRRLVVGVRPVRAGGVRLECERRSSGRAIIHNYGHGGSGFSLSWGCANEVRELALQLQVQGKTDQ